MLQTIMVCDNRDNKGGNMDCTYTYSVGTSFSYSHSLTTSVSLSIKEEFTAELEGLFKETLGVSATTGYDWKTSTDFTTTTERTETVSATAKKGTIYNLSEYLC